MGRPATKNHRCHLRRVYGLMHCVGTYIASYQPVKYILARFDDILRTPEACAKYITLFRNV